MRPRPHAVALQEEQVVDQVHDHHTVKDDAVVDRRGQDQHVERRDDLEGAADEKAAQVDRAGGVVLIKKQPGNEETR